MSRTSGCTRAKEIGVDLAALPQMSKSSAPIFVQQDS